MAILLVLVFIGGNKSSIDEEVIKKVIEQESGDKVEIDLDERKKLPFKVMRKK